MRYAVWESQVPDALRNDVLWRVLVYRLALFAADLGWHDVTRLNEDSRTRALADQLYRALGSVSANIAEGYSRRSGRDQARFYEYALGSARESRDWYYKARHVLSDEVSNHRMDLLSQIIRLLLTMIPDKRKTTIKEAPVSYTSGAVPFTDEPD